MLPVKTHIDSSAAGTLEVAVQAILYKPTGIMDKLNCLRNRTKDLFLIFKFRV